ncbi:MAG: hypothetical protein HYZ65_09475 [Burkholderiales bacterium]|nr:hypothetical protein [Burkholderiales bacterium]
MQRRTTTSVISQALILALICVPAIAQSTASTTSVPAALSKTEATFKCDSNPKGPCYFLLYSSTCEESTIANGKPSLICKHAFVEEFSLAVGESKKLSNLPEKFKQCHQLTDSKPEFPNCAR